MPDDDNVYITRAVVSQIINDVGEKAREESRKVTCKLCKHRFVPMGDPASCPKCRREKSDPGK